MSTAPSREVAQRLARAMVERRLAACVQLLPIDTVYVWDGDVQEEAEVLLLIKARSERLAAIEGLVAEQHPYEVPELVRLDVTGGLPAYLRWIDDVTGPSAEAGPGGRSEVEHRDDVAGEVPEDRDRSGSGGPADG
jgi:periplasmic divalent cation tolerance protein